MATEGDRSLSSGLSLPMWVKTRMTDRLDFDQGAFSPPENDDSFLYIRYPKLISEPKKVSSTNLTAVAEKFAGPPPSNSSSTTKVDFTKHTVPCQKFIPDLSNQVSGKSVKFPPDTKIKSNGTDDGFKGEAAQCGSSVIRVASQMVSSKVTRGFFSTEECDGPPKGFNPSARRGSKSLPASPLGSPNTSPKSRKRLQHKYFTGPFTDSDKYQGSWILANLLGKRENLSRSVDVINEEDPKDDLVKAVSNINIVEENTPKPKSVKQVFKAKPSELREMNFWSPTSM